MLFFAFANCKHRRRNFAAYRKHHSRSEGRDCKIESGGPVVGGYTSNREEKGAKERGTTDTQNISGRQEKNRSGTAGTLGKNQGSKEGVVRYFESAGELPALNSVFDCSQASLRSASTNLQRSSSRFP